VTLEKGRERRATPSLSACMYVCVYVCVRVCVYKESDRNRERGRARQILCEAHWKERKEKEERHCSIAPRSPFVLQRRLPSTCFSSADCVLCAAAAADATAAKARGDSRDERRRRDNKKETTAAQRVKLAHTRTHTQTHTQTHTHTGTHNIHCQKTGNVQIEEKSE